MSKPPAFQFYPSDFLGGSILFNLEQRGLYITMLCIQWDHGHVTQDEWLSLSSAMAQPLAKHVLAKFYKGDDGQLRNLRMEQERAKQDEYRANRSQSGKEGANKRWHSHSTAIAQPMGSHAFANGKPIANDSSPSPSPSPTSTHTRTGQRPEAGECPDASIPTLKEVLAFASMRNILEASAKRFFDHHQNNNLWVNQYGRLIDWRGKVVTWGVKDAEKKSTAPTVSGADKINLGKEYERVLARIKTLSQTEDHMERDAKTKDELKRLRVRRDELKQTLGVMV